MNIKKLLLISLLITIILASEFLFLYPEFLKEYKELLFSKSILKSGFYTLSYAVAVLAVAFIPFIRSKTVFISLSIIAILSYFIVITYTLINHHGFGLPELQVLVNESNKFSSDAWNSYRPYIIKGALLSLAIIILIATLRYFISKNKLYLSTRSSLLTFLVAFSLSMVVIIKTVSTNIAYPVPINVLGTVAYFFANAPYYGPRDKVTQSPSKPKLYNNIVWMIDESIGGKYLSINGYKKLTTPYLASISDKYINLGLASSTVNCSAASNISLMSGIQLNQLPDNEYTALKNPNIFQYAKKAGYKTHYISGQSHDNLLQNYMTNFDLKYIDNFYQPPIFFVNKKIPEGDLVKKIKNILANGKNNFIYVVKRGAHFHWEGQYPKNKTVFQPTLLPTDSLTKENKEKALNSYANAVKYRVDDFFKAFLHETDFFHNTSTLIIYTSDHGQSIIEGDSFGTHCDGVNPNITQGIVPLLLFTNSHQELFKDLQKDKYSSFQLFPTTLELMGYAQFNGKSILHHVPQEQSFYSGDLFGRASSQKNPIN